MNKYFFYFCLLVGFSSYDRTKLAESHASLKIIGGNVFATADAPTRLSDDMRVLIMPLSKHPTNEACNLGHLLDITFHDLVSYQQMSFRLNRRTKTVGDINFVSVAQRIARMQLDNFQLAENFLAADTMTHSLAKRWEQVMSLVNPQDSILVYFSNKADSIKSYSWKEKSYPVVATLEEAREQINHMICEHKQLYYVLLMDPPQVTQKQSGRTPILTNSDTLAKVKKELQKSIGEKETVEPHETLKKRMNLFDNFRRIPVRNQDVRKTSNN